MQQLFFTRKSLAGSIPTAGRPSGDPVDMAAGGAGTAKHVPNVTKPTILERYQVYRVHCSFAAFDAMPPTPGVNTKTLQPESILMTMPEFSPPWKAAKR